MKATLTALLVLVTAGLLFFSAKGASSSPVSPTRPDPAYASMPSDGALPYVLKLPGDQVVDPGGGGGTCTSGSFNDRWCVNCFDAMCGAMGYCPHAQCLNLSENGMTCACWNQ